MWRKLSGVLAVSLISMNVMALPILSESEDGTGLLATIYPDHQDRNKVYFFPNTGSLEKDDKGQPRFGMSYWTPATPEVTAGYFSGIFHLSVSRDLQQSVQNNIKAGKKVAVMPVQESQIYFMQNKDGGRVLTDLFKEVSVAPFGGRAEDSIGISGSLTYAGSKMLAGILSNGGNGADLSYCYQIKGLSPVFHATIDLNYHKLYKHFVAHASGGKWWWKWNIRTEIQKLVESGDIRIVINGGTANQYDYVMTLVDRFVERWMKPELDNRQARTSGKFGMALAITEQDRDFHYELTQRELITREFCVGLGLGELKEFPWLIVNADKQ